MALPPARQVDVPVAHGRLEGLLSEAEGAFAAVVVCHPHPLFGGNLDNPVTARTARVLRDAGATVLRFNFRGVGRSTGRHGKGVDEQEDVSAALDFLQTRTSIPLWVAGYSFGSWVGLTVGAREPRVKRLLGVGLALGLFDYSSLTGCDKPVAVVQGERDEYGSEQQVRAFVGTLAEPKNLFVVPGATHFFGAKLGQLETMRGASVRSSWRWAPARSWRG